MDQYRDRIFEQLLQRMTQDTQVVSPGLQFVLATRHLERIADHATNIAEDIIFWVRGLDVRHGRGLLTLPEVAPEGAPEKAASSGLTPNSTADGVEDCAGAPAASEGSVTNNSHALHSQVTAACETEPA